MSFGKSNESGKLKTPHRVETVDNKGGSKRLHIKDKISGLKFLIDTGSDVSLIPAKGKVKFSPSEIVLFAANNSRISTFGECELTLNLGLRRPIVWKFCRASVPYPIIGADLLAYYGLSVDLRGHRLIDTLTKVNSPGGLSSVSIHSVSTVDKNCPFSHILSEFPKLTSISQPSEISARGVFHHILTKGHPVAERPRRLEPVKLEAAKKQFRNWCKSGVCSSSNSNHAAPLHMILKKTAIGESAVIFAVLTQIQSRTNTLFLSCKILLPTWMGK